VNVRTAARGSLDARTVGTLLALLVLVGSWALVAGSGLFPAEYVPTPLQTLRAARADTGTLWHRTVETMSIVGAGYVLGNALAMVIGIAMGRYEVARSWLGGLVDFMRGIPAVAMIPFAILVFGLRFRVGLFSVAWGCFFLAVTNVADGTRHTPEPLELAVRSFRGSEPKVLRIVVLPSILPYVLASLRQNISVALIIGVVTDMVLGRAGLGYYIIRAQGVLATDRMYAAIVVIAIIGYVVYAVLDLLERRLFPWWSERQLREEGR
jgi:ABC-type nitrate/sulfonate/bicarbonate transport system permease component